MLIDWFTVVAQIINFLILVWLLKRFLYKPILAAMDARQKRIDDALEAAETQKRAAEQERAELSAQRAELESGKAAQLKQAGDEAAATRKALTEKAREEIATQRADWQEALERDRESLSRALAHRAEEEVFATTRAALRDMAGVALEEAMATRFVRRLREMEPAEKTDLKAQFDAAKSPAVVRSAFDLPDSTRAEVENALRTELSLKAPIDFKKTPDLICGIELAADGHKVAWTLADYLTTLQDHLATALEKESNANA